jgi:hypothetical protein
VILQVAGDGTCTFDDAREGGSIKFQMGQDGSVFFQLRSLKISLVRVESAKIC